MIYGGMPYEYLGLGPYLGWALGIRTRCTPSGPALAGAREERDHEPQVAARLTHSTRAAATLPKWPAKISWPEKYLCRRADLFRVSRRPARAAVLQACAKYLRRTALLYSRRTGTAINSGQGHLSCTNKAELEHAKGRPRMPGRCRALHAEAARLLPPSRGRQGARHRRSALQLRPRLSAAALASARRRHELPQPSSPW